MSDVSDNLGLLNSRQMSVSELRDPMTKQEPIGENRFIGALESYAGHIIIVDDIDISTSIAKI